MTCGGGFSKPSRKFQPIINLAAGVVALCLLAEELSLLVSLSVKQQNLPPNGSPDLGPEWAAQFGAELVTQSRDPHP